MKIKNIAFIVIILISTSCKHDLEREYNTSTKKRDLREISEEITPDNFEILTAYISKKEADKQDLEGYKYDFILSSARYMKAREERLIKEEKEKAILEKQKALIIAQNKQLLCGKKWKIVEYTFQMEIPDSTAENIVLAKEALRMALSSDDYKLSIEKRKNQYLARAALGPEILDVLNENGQRRKIYSSDGTYKIMSVNGTFNGVWDFRDSNVIHEKKSQGNGGFFQRNIFTIVIEHLDENTFEHTEIEPHSISVNSTVSSFIVMSAK